MADPSSPSSIIEMHPRQLQRLICNYSQQTYWDYLYEQTLERLRTEIPRPHRYNQKLARSTSKLYTQCRQVFAIGTDGEFRNPFLETSDGKEMRDVVPKENRSRSVSPFSRVPHEDQSPSSPSWDIGHHDGIRFRLGVTIDDRISLSRETELSVGGSETSSDESSLSSRLSVASLGRAL
jgi:hypothetical protein